MNAIDSSLEALAYNYLSYGLLTMVNNIWTWVAVLTAAVSFWRIRASSLEVPRGKCPHGSSQISENVLVLEDVGGVDELREHASTSYIENHSLVFSCKVSSQNNKVPLCAFDGECGTKGKFTLYYCDEKDDEKCGNNNGDGGEVIGNNNNNNNNNGGEYGEGWWSKWEMVMKIKEGDDEWYDFQDLMMINGNIVRLWDWDGM